MARTPTKGGDAASTPDQTGHPQTGHPQSEDPDAAQAAALVGVEAGEVLAFRLYDDRVVVVTVAGRKLEALL